jgi:hypothetical protein
VTSETKNEMTKRKWKRIRGKMIEQQPSWTRHLREIPYGSPEIKKALESGKIDIDTNTVVE